MGIPASAYKWLYDGAIAKDEHELARSDSLDIKSSILLIVIALLATDPAHLLSITTNLWPRIAQIAFIIMLTGAGLLAFAELWPREYRTDPLPVENERWVHDLAEYYGKESDAGDAVSGQIASAMFQRLKERVGHNSALNYRKSGYLRRSFYLTAVSLVIYFAATVGLRF